MQRNGYAAILMLLVVVAILMVLYFIDISSVFGPDVGKGLGDRPWLKESLLVGDDEKVEVSRREKDLLGDGFSISAGVLLNGEDRGTLQLDFTDDGRVSGGWKCSFAAESSDHEIDAVFEGNLVSGKALLGGKDKSRLYFIAKGQYIEKVYDADRESFNLKEGLVYVTGSAASENDGSGILTITTDKSWSVSYDWKK